MKIICTAFNSNLIDTDVQEKIIDFLKSKLFSIGQTISEIVFCDNSQEKIKSILDSNFDLIFCIGTTSSIYNHNIKENFAKLFGDKLVANNSCLTSMKKYCASHNIDFSSIQEMEVVLPSNAIPLCNEMQENYGFMYKFKNSYIIFFPSDQKFAEENYNSFVDPLIGDIVESKKDCLVLKCYGILEKDIRNLISEELNSSITLKIKSERLDNSVYILYESKNVPNIQDIIASICAKLSKFIYATEDTTLYETAVNLLNLQNKKLAIAETLTLGNIVRNLITLDEKVVKETYIFNRFENIEKLFPIDKKIVESYGKNSVNVIYELDNQLQLKSGADLSIFVLGERSSDVCFIAVGDSEGIHVYKNKINSMSTVIESISDTTLFYLIKKLKTDLNFV